MKINEDQQIHEEGVYLSNISAEEIAKTNNIQPLALPFLYTFCSHYFFFFLFFFLAHFLLF